MGFYLLYLCSGLIYPFYFALSSICFFIIFVSLLGIKSATTSGQRSIFSLQKEHNVLKWKLSGRIEPGVRAMKSVESDTGSRLYSLKSYTRKGGHLV